MSRIMVTGAFGQIGAALTPALRNKFGAENVWATGHHLPAGDVPTSGEGPVEILDVTEPSALIDALRRNGIDVVYHLAAKLSAVGEHDPQSAWSINMGGLCNVLEAARQTGVSQVFWPSSIAVFGPGSPLDQTPQQTVMRPTTIYGVSKVSGELLCDYYYTRYGLDVRGLRYPGIISSETLPGGGTTDYAVEMFHAALKSDRYTCFLREDTVLPMMYMPDCLHAALSLMDADLSRLRHHNSFNVAAMSFSPGELAAEIRKHVPDFECTFEPDQRQQIADSWPRSIDDSAARQEWGWRPRFDIAAMTADMFEKLRDQNQS